MGNELKAGLVGCGSVSQRGILPHLSLPDARQSVRLVAVADAVEERARESAQRFDVPAHFTSLEEMLATAPGYGLCSTTRRMRQLVSEGALGRVCVAYTSPPGSGPEREPIRGGAG